MGEASPEQVAVAERSEIHFWRARGARLGSHRLPGMAGRGTLPLAIRCAPLTRCGSTRSVMERISRRGTPVRALLVGQKRHLTVVRVLGHGDMWNRAPTRELDRVVHHRCPRV